MPTSLRDEENLLKEKDKFELFRNGYQEKN